MKQLQKLFKLILILIAAQILSFTVILSKNNNTDFSSDTSLIASVGGYKISISDFAQRYSDYLFTTGMKDNPHLRKAILNNMINEYLLLNIDDHTTTVKDPNYIREINWAKKQIILAYLKDQDIYAKIIVTEEEMRETFEHSNEKLAARHLFAKTEEEANEMYQLLNIGVEFDFLARQVFTDSTLRDNGGYVGYFSWGDMDPAFEEAAYSLKVGEISKPVKTEHGYSIIKLEDRIIHPLLTETEFIQKKSHLERVLRIKKKNKSEAEFIKNIFNPKDVIFDGRCLDEMFKIINEPVPAKIENVAEEKYSEYCASYKENKYTKGELFKLIDDLPSYHRAKITSFEKLKVVIQGFILQAKLLSIAKSKKYDKLDVVEEKYRNLSKYILLKFKRDEVMNRKELSDSSLLAYYQNNIQQFTSENELNIQEIIVADHNLADSIKDLIIKGADFGELAEKYSLRRWSGVAKGVMGYAPLSRYGMLKDKFWESSAGNLIGPIDIGNYYGIFKVLGKKEGEPLEYGTVKEKIKHTLRFEQQAAIIKDHLDQLHQKVNIMVNENLLLTCTIAG